KTVNEFAADVSEGYNLADVINEALEEEAVARYQIRAILNALLVDKLGYVTHSHNLETTVEDAEQIIDVTSTWGRVHLILCYYHPQAGLFVINPANPAHWDGVLPLVEDEYFLLLVGPAGGNMSRKTLESAAKDFMKVLYGRKVKDDSAYKGPRKVLKPASALPSFEETEAAHAASSAAPVGEAPAEPAARRGGSKKRITPKYSVVVTNELFHNGNVEAWKKIIQSYKTKYPGLDVLIWYENERINDINSLFKWGKVKHGVPILFSVAGDDIQDVRKLQRYLYEGASPRFEAFLKGGYDQVLDLF
ncbi:MAG: hypothetical protein ACLFP4_17570, partial [Spirochaetales bacterium]